MIFRNRLRRPYSLLEMSTFAQTVLKMQDAFVYYIAGDGSEYKLSNPKRDTVIFLGRSLVSAARWLNHQARTKENEHRDPNEDGRGRGEVCEPSVSL
jgi:hypothetical protein